MKEKTKQRTNQLFRNAIDYLKASRVLKVYIAMVLVYLLSCIIEPNYFSMDFIMSLLLTASFLGIVSMGQTLVVLTKGIDLSVAYMLNLGACILTQVSSRNGSLAGVLITLAVGLILGALNGVGIAYLRISPMIMTLAMNYILASFTYVYTNGTPKGASPEWLKVLATGDILGIKFGILFWFALGALLIFILQKTSFGRKVYAVGNSERVSFLAGINYKAVIIKVYALSGMFAVIAGVMLAGYCGSANLGMGNAYQLQSVSAVVIGGTSILGGKGGYAGTIPGAIIMFILASLLTVLNIADAGRYIVYGAVILTVFFLYGRSKKQMV